MLEVLFVLQAMQVPIYLVTIFELTYLIHKRRSVHFLGMYFDEGRLGKRVKGVFSTPCKSFLARNFIRILSTLLFVIGITVNFNVLPDLVTVGDLAGKTGWWNLFKNKRNLQEALDVVMSLFPTAILIFCSFVLCTTLWMYGTNTSMIVHSSFINPWFAPFFGTLVLTIGQFFTVGWFAISSNAGFLVYTVTLILLMKQIDRDIVSFAEFTDFLHQVAKKGNEISVHNVITSKLDGSGHGAAIAPSFTSSGLRLGPSNNSSGVSASGAGGIGLPDLEEERGNGNNMIL